MNLQEIRLSENSQSQRASQHMIPFFITFLEQHNYGIGEHISGYLELLLRG